MQFKPEPSIALRVLAEPSDLDMDVKPFPLAPAANKREFCHYLDCSILAHGFSCIRRDGCRRDFLVAYSSKNWGGGNLPLAEPEIEFEQRKA